MSNPTICSIWECHRRTCVFAPIVADIKDGNLGRQTLRVGFCEYHGKIAFPQHLQQQSPLSSSGEQQKK